MGKIDFNIVPAVKREVHGPFVFDVPGQGQFTFYLREITYPQMLATMDRVSERTQKWCRPGANRYPTAEPLEMSTLLWQCVTALEFTLCQENGEPFKADDAVRYTEEDLLLMASRLPGMFDKLGSEAQKLVQRAAGEPGNSPEASGEASSAPQLGNSTPTPTP